MAELDIERRTRARRAQTEVRLVDLERTLGFLAEIHAGPPRAPNPASFV